MHRFLGRSLRTAERAVNITAGSMAAASALVIALIALVVSYNVIQRLTFGFPVPGIIEISGLALVVVAFGGAAQAELSEAHVRMSILADRVSRRWRMFILATAQVVFIAILVIWINAAFERTWASYLSNETKLGLSYFSVWPVRFVIVAGLVVLLAVCVAKLVQALTRSSESTSSPEPGTQSPGGREML